MTTQNDSSVKDYIASLDDEQTVKDSQVLIKIMQRISGHKPKMWNVGTIGFGNRSGGCQKGRWLPSPSSTDGICKECEELASLF